jgi:IS1 family transposase
MEDRKILDYYSNHNVKSTLKEFNITYSELKDICERNNFVKSSDQIKETYKTTRIEKYGSIELYRLAKRQALERNSFNR